VKLDPKSIRIDGGTQPRAELLIDVMEDYAEQMRNGVEFPPITVFFDGKEYWLADGFHRLGAALRARPDDPIEAEVIQGTQSDAQWYSYGVNITHGLRRTNEDKERVVRAALRHPNASTFSNVQIANHCGVNEITVRRYRTEMEPSSTKSKMRNVTRGGTTYRQNTSNIGKNPKSRRSRQPSRRMASRIQQPTRAPNPVEKMTALSMPHNPVMGARTLIEVFDADYLRAVVDEISSYLQGLEA